jgi:cell division protein FtsQ
MKGIFNFIRFLVVILVIGFMIYFAGRNNREKYCKITDITIEMDENVFVTNDVINDYLLDNNLHPDSIKMNDVSFKNIESLLENHPSIKFANVYSDMQGKVFVLVVQRKPIVRVQNGAEGYYLDEDGLRMELSNKYTARMLLVTGEVNLLNENDLYYLSYIIIKDEFLKKQIVQIDINKYSELLMLTQIGEQVEFGKIKEVGEKFEKLKLYYEKGNSQNQEYKELNLKYKNQIVCVKNK